MPTLIHPASYWSRLKYVHESNNYQNARKQRLLVQHVIKREVVDYVTKIFVTNFSTNGSLGL
jgi:hypothetical protein